MSLITELSSFEAADADADATAVPSPACILQKQKISSPKNTNNNNTDEITFLIEFVKATIPKHNNRRGGNKKSSINNDHQVDATTITTTKRGMHCTAYWVGPINPSGRKRREKLLHRTKTMKIRSRHSSDCSSPSDSFEEDNDGLEEEDDDMMINIECTEHIFTINDASLFLFKTSMKQLINASIAYEDSTSDMYNSGGLRFDIFEKPSDNLLTKGMNTVFVLDENIIEKENNAAVSTQQQSSSITNYRLIGSVFLTPREVIQHCDEVRFTRGLIEDWRGIQRTTNTGNNNCISKSMKSVNGANLALRIRVASEYDVAFMKSLSRDEVLSQQSNNMKLQPATLITELDENLLTAETSMKAIGNISPLAQESMRYFFSDDTEKRILVKPYPDPSRVMKTTFMLEEELILECQKASTNWIQAGQHQACSNDDCDAGNSSNGNSLGRVYMEILECRGLPNTDAGGAVGNKTDAFVSIIYGDIMVQSEVIDDSCSPMWPPWCSRAFVFNVCHPSTAIHIGVADYDIGPLEHECIGRVGINLNKFTSGLVYTLTYNLFPTCNLTEKGEDVGTITLRLRMDIFDEKKYLLKGWQAPEPQWVNSQQWKSHRVAKYCVDGPHDEEIFEMALFRSHINELLTQKRYISYAISDAMKSLIYWRGQVKVGNAWLPLHSAVVFYFSIHVVENPHLIPSFLLFGAGWVMLANMFANTVSHPNPWHRGGHSFARYWSILTCGGVQSSPTPIAPLEGHKETTRLETKWKKRLADDDAKWAQQYELDMKVKAISDDAIIRTKTKASATTAVVDPISAVAGAKLLPYQQRLSRYCKKMRYIRNVSANIMSGEVEVFILCCRSTNKSC